MILRTVISVNQLSIYGAVADLCKEFDPESRNHVESEICETLVRPTEIANANATSQSSTSLAQGDLLQEYCRKFAELLDDQKLSKLCSDAGFSKEIGKGQFFMTIEEGSEVVLENTLNIETSQHPDREEYEDRPSLGCETLSSRSTLLCWYHDRIIVWRPNSFMGSHCEWYQQIRHRNGRRNSHWERSTVHKHRETCGKG